MFYAVLLVQRWYTLCDYTLGQLLDGAYNLE